MRLLVASCSSAFARGHAEGDRQARKQKRQQRHKQAEVLRRSKADQQLQRVAVVLCSGGSAGWVALAAWRRSPLSSFIRLAAVAVPVSHMLLGWRCSLE